MSGTVGAMMLLAACLFFAASAVKAERDKLQNLAEMERAIFLLRYEISFSTRELWEACEGLASSLDGAVSRMFFSISDDMKQDETLSFATCWQQHSEGLFPCEAEKVISSFAATFGTLTRELEESALCGCSMRLSEIRQREQTVFAKNRKLMYTLSTGAGLAIVILLI